MGMEADLSIVASVNGCLHDDGAENAPVARHETLHEQESILGEGAMVGPFRIMGRLGQGGMGQVYLACRADDLELKVALKALTLWQPKMLDMFRAECRILSSLKHPGIAHLIDAGTTSAGQPWLAMEYVDGLPLSQYISVHNPNLKERLELILQICDALKHAHGQMIVHRDLKPGNIMVTDEGRIKLLDFGIASTLDPQSGEQFTVTMQAERMMTPEYASPEHINGHRLTAASDVYSLGVLLFEMLTGFRPYSFASRNPLEIINTVNTIPITRPSGARSQDGLARSPFVKRLRGDLDTITLKALERDLERRYPSVETLANDLRLHLAGLPITARPANLSYRLLKFTQRNPWPIALGTVTVLFLLGFAVYANHQRQRVSAERDQAKREQKTAQSVTNFLISLFQQIDPDEARRGDVTAFEVMELGRKQLTETLEDQPEVKIQLLAAMGRVYGALGKHQPSQDLFKEVIRLEKQHSGATMSARFDLLEAQQAAGNLWLAEATLSELKNELPLHNSPDQLARFYYAKGQLSAAQGQYLVADKAYMQAASYYVFDEKQQVVFDLDRATLAKQMGLNEKAMEQFTFIIDRQRKLYGENHSTVAKSLLELVQLYNIKGDYDHSQVLLDKVEKIYEQLYEKGHPQFAELLSARGSWLFDKGQYDDSADMLEACLKLRRETLGEKHPLTISAIKDLGSVREYQGKLLEAEQFQRKAVEMAAAQFGKEHPEYANCLNNLATVLEKEGDLSTAESLHRQALQIKRMKLGELHPEVATSLNNLAMVLKNKGDFDAAIPLMLQCLRIRRAMLGERHTDIAGAMNNLAAVYELKNDLNNAEKLYSESLDIIKENTGEKSLNYCILLNNLALLALRKDETEKAEKMIRRCLAITIEVGGNEHNLVWSFKRTLGSILAKRNDPEAEQLFKQALALVRKGLGEKNAHYALIKCDLGYLYQKGGRAIAAEAELTDAYQIYRILGRDRLSNLLLLDLAEIMLSQGRAAEARDMIARAMPHIRTEFPESSKEWHRVQKIQAEAQVAARESR